MLISTKEIGVTEIPQPAHSTWQYGKKTDYFTTEQLIAFGQACANAAYVAATIKSNPHRPANAGQSSTKEIEHEANQPKRHGADQRRHG
jgi:hypothetical protein